MVAFELGRDVFGVGLVKEDDADVFNDAAGFVDAMAEIVGLAGGPKTGAGRLFFLKALKPRFGADDV